MIIWTPAVLSVLYACVLYFCICTCSAQLSMFYMERCSRNMLIIITLSEQESILWFSNFIEWHLGVCTEIPKSDADVLFICSWSQSDSA